MKRITETALRKYLVSLLETPRIKSFIQDNSISHCRTFLKYSQDGSLMYPLLTFRDTTYGPTFAGVSHTWICTEIARWILADATEAKGVMRHELAHLLHAYTNTGGMVHGKEYRAVLKVVSPITWRRDRHWHPNPVIEKARLLVHPTSKAMDTFKVGKRYYAVHV